MATRYVRSTDGSDADNGTTWALAKQTIAGVSAIDAAGDIIFLSQAHAESTAGVVTFAGAGTNASPTRVLCGNDAAEPPTALATTATVTTTGVNPLTLSGALYWYGTSFISSADIRLNYGSPIVQRYERCSFQPVTNVVIGIAGQDNKPAKLDFVDCTWKFSDPARTIQVSAVVSITGGSFVSGTSAPTALFSNPGDRNHCEIHVTGVDCTNLGNFNWAGAPASGNMTLTVRNCKLPTSWSGTLVNGTLFPGCRYEMHNCDAGNTNYRIWVEDFSGSIKSETTIVKSSGASDGTTPLSWKMASSAGAIFPALPLVSPEMVIWNDTTGSSKTVTVEIVHDTNVAGGQGAGTANAFQDDEVWLEVDYLGDGSFPLSTRISDCKADVLAAAADQTSSSVTWTTTGLTTPVKQKLNVSFTPQKKGYIHARVVLAKASKTIYVDPMLTVT